MIACEHRFHRSGRPLGLSPAVIQEGRASGGGAERTSASIGAGDGAADAADGRSGLTGASTAEEVLSAKEVRGVRSAKAERSAEEEPRPTPEARAPESLGPAGSAGSQRIVLGTALGPQVASSSSA